MIRVALVTAQVVLFALVLRAFTLENRTTFHLLLLAAAAFPVSALLPRPRRLKFFALVSIGGLFVALSIPSAIGIVVALAVLAGIAHLRISWRARIALLVAIGVLAMAARVGLVPNPVPFGIWAILGSMFMFRLALYVHARRFGDVPSGPWHATAYFLMLPNPAFPLFPVVDYATFVKSQAEGEDAATHERGLKWMYRGLAHLLLHRLVYYYLTLDTIDVRTLGQVLQFAVSAFLLYLRVSGQFHLIVGLLHLFGFHLPETHRLYYLASSFTDLWRRINLYWTDFMMKLVYYPVLFRLRQAGQLRAMIAGTVAVFFVTWFLHGYQNFWLLGEWAFTWPDAVFWAVLGALVVATTLYERSRPRRPVPGWRLGRALAVAGTFLGMGFLWSLWNSESLRDWLSVISAARSTSATELGWIAILLALFLAIAGRSWDARRLIAPRAPVLADHWRHAAIRAGAASVLLLVASPRIQGTMPPRPRVMARSLSLHRLNARDEALLQRGYYERLNAAGRTGGALWEVYAERPPHWRGELGSTRLWRQRDDLLIADLEPGQRIDYKGRPFTTNGWGMRDREYPLAKPPGTLRIAVLGPSLVMGYGVGDGEPFDHQLELRLASSGQPAEVLNFGFEGHSLIQQLMTFEQRVSRFEPDIVMVTVSPIEHRLMAEHLRRALAQGATIGYDTVAAVLRAARLEPGATATEVVRGLRPWDTQLQQWALTELVARIRARGAEPVALALRMPTQVRGRLSFTTALARDAGFRVLDLSQVFEGHDEDTLRVAAWDRHPSAAAHRIVAEGLERELQAAALLGPK